MKTKIFTALLFFFVSLPTLAQMVSQTVDTAVVNGSGFGQSFVATATTQITQISVRPNVDYAGTLYLYNGNVGSGTILAVGAPAYTQAGINLTSTTSGGPMRVITLTTPFPVTAGNSYTFVLDGGASLRSSGANPYADGQFIFGYANQAEFNRDLAFEVFAAPVAPAATTASIPTLGEWGLIFMSGLLAMFGLVSVRRRKASA